MFHSIPFLDCSNDPIPTGKLYFAISQVPSHKIPGLDGFPVEWYVNMKQMLSPYLPKTKTGYRDPSTLYVRHTYCS